MERKHWSFVGHVALGSFVIAPPLAPVLTSAAALVAVRHSAWEQSMALKFDDTQQSLLRTLEAGIRKMGMKRYVPDKVMLVCSSGIKSAKLKVTSQATVTMASGRLVGTLPDKMDCNMMCAMLIVGGAIAGAIMAAVIVAAIVLSGGTVGIALGMAIGAGGAAAGAGVGAALAAFIPCLCAMLTGPWIPVHPRMIVCGQPALIEDSKLTCFLGGTVSIFYSPEAAEMVAAINRRCMWWDLAGVVLNSIIMSGAIAGVAGFLKGTTLLAKAGKEGLGALALYAGVGGVSTVLGIGAEFELKRLKEMAYTAIPMGESTYQKYVSGKVVSDKATEMNKVDQSGDYGGADTFSRSSDIVGYLPQDIKPKSGVIDAVMVTNVKGLGIPKAYAGASLLSFAKSSGISFGLSVVDDWINAKKSSVLIEALDESGHFDSLESAAKAGVKVCENDI